MGDILVDSSCDCFSYVCDKQAWVWVEEYETHESLWILKATIPSKLDPENFGGQDHHASAEQRQGVLKKKSSTSSLCKENKRSNIQE